MDIHPTGFPGLVGPEGGSGFNHFDLSSHFRIMPNTSSNDLGSANQDTLAFRSLLHAPQLHASPIAVPPTLPHPLRIGDDMNSSGNGHTSKNGSPRLASPPAQLPHHHLLPPDSVPSLLSPRFSSKSTSAPPARLLTPENDPNEADLVRPLENSKDVPVLQEI